MQKLINKNSAFKHLSGFGLKQAILDIAKATKEAQIIVIFDREQRAKIIAANAAGISANLTYAALAKVGTSEKGRMYDLNSPKLVQDIANVAVKPKYGVDFINGFLVIKGTPTPSQRPTVEPIQTEYFKDKPTVVEVKTEPSKAEVDSSEIEVDNAETEADNAEIDALPVAPKKGKKA